MSIRAALYARVSTTSQDAEMQLAELRDAADQRGWEVIHEALDDGVSGAVPDRDALDIVMRSAAAGCLDVVAVWKLDRWGRSLSHLLTTLDTLTAQGVDFVSLRDPGIDTTTPTGRLLLQLLGAFAEFERALIRERVIAGVRRAQTAGTHCGRPKVALDLRPALAMLDQGHGLKTTAKALGVSRATLRRRLTEADEWPRPEGVQKGSRPAGP